MTEPSRKRSRNDQMEGKEKKNEDSFDRLYLSLMKRKLETVHPRAKGRTQTMWWSAVTCEVSELVSVAFERMAEHSILSLPVLERGKCVGILKMEQMVDWIVDEFDKPPDVTELTEYFQSQSRWKRALVTDLMSTTARRGFYRVMHRYSIYRAFETLARTDARRVVITDENLTVKGILTQSMMVGEIFNNLNLLGRLRQTKVKDLTKTYFVATVRESSPAMDAFRRMTTEDITGVAVVNDNGELVDSLSARDLKGIRPTAETFVRLFMTVKEFKDLVRKEGRQSEFTKIPATPQWVTNEHTLEDVITLLDRQAIHRIFVVESSASLKPINIITQTDILRHIAPELKWL